MIRADRFNRFWRLLAVGLVFSACESNDAPCSAAEQPVDFNNDVRPILSDRCFSCHGPDGESRQAGLRLDDRTVAVDESAVIVPGDAEASELVRRVLSEDPAEVMPPPGDTDEPLSEAERQILQRWVSEGAPYEQHWSFVPPRRPGLPPVDEATWQRPVDRFVLARMQEEGLSPSPEADKRTLLRRVSFDLTGLPPTLDELESFVEDTSSDAFEKAVDRLLASPRYGEHMARYWLDAARYGDTHGKHLDNYREMWPYRDWVVKAFNQNMRFDDFTLAQLAGDLLPDSTLDQLVATGFNRCHATTGEGGSIEEEVYVGNVIDRVTTVGTVYLGLTMECTRCHDHKFDPLTMEDFYSLFGYFNSLDGDALDGNRRDHPPYVKAPSQAQQDLRRKLCGQIDAFEKELFDSCDEVDSLQAAWEQELRQSGRLDESFDGLLLGEWYSVGPFSDEQRYLVGRHFGPEGKDVNLSDEFALGSGEKVSWRRRSDWVDGIVHRDFAGEMAATYLYRTITSPQARTVSVSFGSGDGYRLYLNGKLVHSSNATRSVAADQEELELELAQGENHLLIKLMNFGGESGFYLQIAGDASTLPAEAHRIFNMAAPDRTAEDQDLLTEIFRYRICEHPAVVERREALRARRQQLADLERSIPTTLVWRELDEPRPSYLLKRGSYDQHGKQVDPRTPAVLPELSDDLPPNRLGLARWLVDPDQPLTARVTVNRFWQQVFGTGLVKTSDDFGAQGSPPSHPELLDWLAVDFIENGWNVKRLMKQLVTSATYRQSSRSTPERYRNDPENRLLARGSRYRLDGEMLRDQALAASGLLVNRLGGPGVKPPQPDGLWEAVGYSGSNTVKFVPDTSHRKVHRRTLYTFIKRTAPPPQMSTFDGPSRESCSVGRDRTNTPMQALLLMNDPQFVEAAEALAKRAMARHQADDERAAYLFRLCTGRKPGDEELRDLLQTVADERAAARSAPSGKLISHRKSPSQETDDPIELRAWTVLANLVLNLDEVVTKN